MWNNQFQYPPFTTPYVVVQQPPMPNMMPPVPPVPPPPQRMNKSELRSIKKAIKFYTELLDSQKKKEAEKKKPENIFLKPHMFVLYTFASPFIGLAYLGLLKVMFGMMQTVFN